LEIIKKIQFINLTLGTYIIIIVINYITYYIYLFANEFKLMYCVDNN